MDRPRGSSTNEIWGEKAEDLQKVLDIFRVAPTAREIETNSTLFRELTAQAHPYMEACIQRAIQSVMLTTFGQANPTPSRKPKVLPSLGLIQLKDSVETFLPRSNSDNLPEKIFATYLMHRVAGYLFTYLLTYHPDNPLASRVLEMTYELALQSTDDLAIISTNNTRIITNDFLSKNPPVMNDLGILNESALDSIAKEMTEKIAQHGTHEVPSTLCHDEDIFRKPICLMTESLPSGTIHAALCGIDFDILDASYEAGLVADPAARETRRIRVQAGDSIHKRVERGHLHYLINRLTGELHTLSLGPESLKLILGRLSYQTIRVALLLRYAQLVTDEDVFVREFGKFVTAVPAGAPHPRTSGGNDAPSQNHTPTLPLRFFPRPIRPYLQGGAKHSNTSNTKNTDSAESEPKHHIKGRQTGHYRRLLPLGWKPTTEGYANAQAAQVDLLHHFETVYQIDSDDFTFVTPGLAEEYQKGTKLFTRQEMQREADSRKISIDACIRLRGVQERQYNFVKGHEIGEVSDTVRARFGYILNKTPGGGLTE